MNTITDGEVPEEWRPVLGFEDYEVSNLGRVRSKDRVRPDMGGRGGARRDRKLKGRILAVCLHKGYPHVNLTVKSVGHPRAVHRLVLEAFVGPAPQGMQCRHLNGTRTDARLCNLAWGTPTENQADRARHETDNKGSRHPMSKLTEKDVQEITRLLEDGVGQREIGKLYGVTGGCINSINSGKIWSHTTGIQHTRKGVKKKLNDENVLAIMQLLTSGVTHAKIAKEYGVSVSLIGAIGTGRAWSHVTGWKTNARDF